MRKSKLKRVRARRATYPISDTYDQILAVAEQEFANSGYNGTSLEVIARRTGIRKASLFHHFNSKRKIFDAVVRRIFDQLVSIGRETAQIENPKEHLLAILVRLHDFIASHPNHARLLMHRVLEDPASVRRSSEVFIKPLVTEMAQLVVRGAEMGVIRNSTDGPISLTLIVTGDTDSAVLLCTGGRSLHRYRSVLARKYRNNSKSGAEPDGTLLSP